MHCVLFAGFLYFLQSPIHMMHPLCSEVTIRDHQFISCESIDVNHDAWILTLTPDAMTHDTVTDCTSLTFYVTVPIHERGHQFIVDQWIMLAFTQ